MAKKKPELTPEQAAAEEVEKASLREALEDYDGYIQAQAQAIWQYDEIPVDGLNLEEQLFVRSYIIDRNPVAAMRRLGHLHEDSPKLKRIANRYLEKTPVKEAVDFLAKRVMDKLDITAEKVMARIAAVAFFDQKEVLEFDRLGVRMLNSRYWTPEQMQAVRKVKNGQYGLELEFYDGMKAAEMLAKMHNLLPDEDGTEATRAAAEAVMEKIGQIAERLIPIPQLPPPIEQEAEGPATESTKH